jgi:hypothetical protein
VTQGIRGGVHRIKIKFSDEEIILKVLLIE